MTKKSTHLQVTYITRDLFWTKANSIKSSALTKHTTKKYIFWVHQRNIYCNSSIKYTRSGSVFKTATASLACFLIILS